MTQYPRSSVASADPPIEPAATTRFGQLCRFPAFGQHRIRPYCGRSFWQARFRAVRLLDETAILACMQYVDLNPIRAALAETGEDSDFTSAQKRAGDLRSKCSDAGVQFLEKPVRASGRHLPPVELKESDGKTGPNVHKAGARCSNKGFLPMSTADYLELLDWTARQARRDKQGATPKQFAPLFERLGISADVWCHLVQDFGRLFSVVAGQPHKIDEHRSRTKDSSHRFRTRQATRELMSPA